MRYASSVDSNGYLYADTKRERAHSGMICLLSLCFLLNSMNCIVQEHSVMHVAGGLEIRLIPDVVEGTVHSDVLLFGHRPSYFHPPSC